MLELSSNPWILSSFDSLHSNLLIVLLFYVLIFLKDILYQFDFQTKEHVTPLKVGIMELSGVVYQIFTQKASKEEPPVDLTGSFM